MTQELKKIIKFIKKYDRIIITGHKNPDFDSFGSSLGMYSICKSLNKEALIYLDEETVNSSLKKGIEQLNNSKQTFKIINAPSVKKYIDNKTLLIITDTCKDTLIEYQELLVLDTIIIDHHIKDKDSKFNLIYSYIDNTYSSACEIVTFFLNELKIVPSQVVATLLLVGIEIDTNSYSLRTTEKTFIAASILMKYGALNTIKNEVLKETREEYLRKMELIKRSYMIKEHTMLCVLDNNIYDQKDLAEVADELLQFENVEVSFVIGKIKDNKTSISSRSIGKTNVQKIMQELGGGGSNTSAGVQFDDLDIKQIKQKLLNIIMR